MPTLNTKALRARLSAKLKLEEAVNDLGDLYLKKHTTVEQDDLIDGIYPLARCPTVPRRSPARGQSLIDKYLKKNPANAGLKMLAYKGGEASYRLRGSEGFARCMYSLIKFMACSGSRHT